MQIQARSGAFRTPTLGSRGSRLPSGRCGRWPSRVARAIGWSKSGRRWGGHTYRLGERDSGSSSHRGFRGDRRRRHCVNSETLPPLDSHRDRRPLDRASVSPWAVNHIPLPSELARHDAPSRQRARPAHPVRRKHVSGAEWSGRLRRHACERPPEGWCFRLDEGSPRRRVAAQEPAAPTKPSPPVPSACTRAGWMSAPRERPVSIPSRQACLLHLDEHRASRIGGYSPSTG